MSDTASAHAAQRESFGATPGKIAMWLFLASDAMGFMGLIIAYMVLRVASPVWIPEQWQPDGALAISLTAVMTFILICSSMTMVLALAAVRRNDQKGLVRYMAMTLLGGLTFLCLQVYEWTHLIGSGFTAPSSNYAATFFSLTGFHGAHVTSGVIYLLILFPSILKGKYSSTNHSPIELYGLFWHFVDLVWIILFTIIYLI